MPWEPCPAPCHWSASLPHAAQYRKGWWGRLFLPPSLSTAGSTMRSREYNVENQKCTTVMTVSASLMDPGLAQAEESIHSLSLQPRLLQPSTGKLKGKGAAAEPNPAPLGPCGGWQDWATSPPATSDPTTALLPGWPCPSLPALEHTASHHLQSDRQVSQNQVI